MAGLAILAVLAAGQDAAPATLPVPIVFVSPEYRKRNEKEIEAIRSEKPVRGWRIVRKQGIAFAVSESLPEIVHARRVLRLLDSLGPTAVSGKPIRTAGMDPESRRAIGEIMDHYSVGVVGEDGFLLGDPAFAITPSILLTFAGEGRQGSARIQGSIGEQTPVAFRTFVAGLREHPLVRDERRAEAGLARWRDDPSPSRWQMWFEGMSELSPAARDVRARTVELTYETIDRIVEETDKAIAVRVGGMIAAWPDGPGTMEPPLGSSPASLPRMVASQAFDRLTTYGGPKGMTEAQKREWHRHVTLSGRRIGFDLWFANPGAQGAGAVVVWP